jgi:glycerate-2-kinase
MDANRTMAPTRAFATITPGGRSRVRILNMESLAGHGNVEGRRAVLEILEAGLQAADPYKNTRKLVRIEGNKLIVGNTDFEPGECPRTGDEVFDLDQLGRIYVVGAAKGIQYIAKALEDTLGDRLTGGHVIAKHGDEHILERIGVTYGAHPVPDEGCVEGCHKILELCQGLTENDLVFTIAGNGISALLTMPVPGVSLEDVQKTTYLMQIDRGAPTEDLNPVRNHLDMMKGGRISRYLQPARAIHILGVDPQGSPTNETGQYNVLVRRNIWLHTLPEGSTFERAVQMLKRWDAWDEVPASVREHLLRADPALETVKYDEFERGWSRIFGVMPKRLGMLPTAAAKARELGYEPHLMATFLRAEAREAGYAMMDIAKTVANLGSPFKPPCVLLSTGELLVTVGQETGVGGRNQEYALASALKIVPNPQIVVGAVDTDGTDGPGTQFSHHCAHIPCLAGGICDSHTVSEFAAAGLDVHDVLKRHDTTPALWETGNGILASHNISVGDLGVVLIMDHA